MEWHVSNDLQVVICMSSGSAGQYIGRGDGGAVGSGQQQNGADWESRLRILIGAKC